tara:strand:+ start:49 stop:195 length:147 start_codon:yes stop_codon:yes gene_type:complete
MEETTDARGNKFWQEEETTAVEVVYKIEERVIHLREARQEYFPFLEPI